MLTIMATRGRIGVAVQEVNQALADTFRLAKPAGALVSYVEPGGAAAKGGLKSGDVILDVQGRDVVQAADALGFIADLPPGEFTRLRVWRDRAEQVIEVVVDRLDAAPQPQAVSAPEQAPLGIALRALAPRERQVLRIEGGRRSRGREGRRHHRRPQRSAGRQRRGAGQRSGRLRWRGGLAGTTRRHTHLRADLREAWGGCLLTDGGFGLREFNRTAHRPTAWPPGRPAIA